MKRIINRYIFKEVSLVFALILLILTFVLLMGKAVSLMDLIINKGVRFVDVARLILFLLPSLMVYTIPISLLVATLIGIGRLSSDSEITVMKSSGISLYQLLSPVFAIALVSFLATAGMSLFLSPAGNKATKDLLFTIAQYKASVGIQERVFNLGNLPVLYAEMAYENPVKVVRVITSLSQGSVAHWVRVPPWQISCIFI